MQSVELLEKAFSVVDEGIGILDQKAHLAFINKAGKEIFLNQIQMAPSTGDDFLSFIHPDCQELYRSFIAEAFNNQCNSIIANYPQQEQETWFELSYAPVVEPDGSINYVFVKAKNITDKIKLEKEKEALQHKMVEATIAAQEQERSTIGRELHDNVNQVLTTIKLYNEICYYEEKPNKELLQKSLVQVNYCIQEIRDLSRRLAVPQLETTAMAESIKDLIDSINATKKTSIQLLTHGIKNMEVSFELQTTIYRIIQEQLTNIIKYACASEVKVILARAGSDIAIQVQDNGIGFNLNEKKNSNGLTNMKSRAEAVGGSIKFDTAPGRGCTLTAEFPL